MSRNFACAHLLTYPGLELGCGCADQIAGCDTTPNQLTGTTPQSVHFRVIRLIQAISSLYLVDDNNSNMTRFRYNLQQHQLSFLVLP